MQARQVRKQPTGSAAPAAIEFDVEDEDQYYVTRPHTSARRYNTPPRRDTLEDPLLQQGPFIQRRRSAMSPVSNSGIASKAVVPSTPNGITGIRHARRFPLLAVILGMLVMAALAVTFSTLGNWWKIHQDDATYGRPRTFQMDAVVGHNDSAAHLSHFIFLNLNRHVEIIELPGGDSSRARIYSGPVLFGDGQDLTPITGEFRDVNGDGKPDMIVHIQDQRLVYINDGTAFRPLRPGEQVNP